MGERVAVLTVSDTRTAADDGSGDAIVAWAAARGATIAARALVRDDTLAIAAQLAAWCDGDAADVVLTTGGTGLAGTRGATLVINLPGSTGGVRDALAALDPVLAHAVAVLRDRPTEHSAGRAPGGNG